MRRRIFSTLVMLMLISVGYSSEHESVHLLDDVIKRYDIQLAKAHQQPIEITRDVIGKIVPNANKTIFIYPRYSGIVQDMRYFLGDEVQQGALLAKVESNQSLQVYEVKAPFAGFIVKKQANPGEFVTTSHALYQIADLDTVWVHLFIYRDNAELIKKGQSVIVFDKSNPDKSVTSEIDYVSPLGVEHTQTMKARVVLDNKSGIKKWLPGLYVNARIVIEKKQVPLAVKNTAIQEVEGKRVVFVKTDEGFEPRACEFGLAGQDYTEVTKGLVPQEIYVTHNSFILKAELEKGSASHSH